MLRLCVRVSLVLCALVPQVAVAQAAPLPTTSPHPLTARVFIDLDCAFSRQAWPLYRKLLPADATLVVQHLPLSRHPLALPAAVAAIAARGQGKELAFVDAVMASPSPDEQTLQHAATQAGVDVATWEAARKDPAVLAQTQREQQAGLALGITTTPTLLLNGRGIRGVAPVETLRAGIRQALRNRADVGDDPERGWLLTTNPELVPALDALRTGRALSVVPAEPRSHGNLGERWRVPVRPTDLAWGRDNGVTIVQFLDPTSPWQRQELARWLRLQADEAKAGRPDIRVVVKLLLFPAQRAWKDGQAPLALWLAGAQLTAPEKAAVLARALVEPPQAMAVWEKAAQAAQLDPTLLRRAADAPTTTGWLQEGMAEAEGVAAQAGAVFLNGRVWRGLASDSGVAAALATLRAERKALGPQAGAYATLVSRGRWLTASERDLAQPEALGDLAGAAVLGQTGQPVHLFVDFRSPHSRAAFYMLRRLVTSATHPVRLTIASLASGSEPGVTVSGLSIVAAARLGKGMEMAEALFSVSKPDDWATVYGALKKLRVDTTTFQKTVEAPETRAAIRRIREAKLRLDMADEPVIYIGDRLYQGPLDEARLERAVQHVQETAVPPQPAPQQ